MTDHLIDRCNLKDLGIAIIVGLALAALLFILESAHAQSSAAMGLIEQGASMAQSLAIQHQSMQMQEQTMRNQQAAQTPPYASCPAGYRHQIIIHADGQKTLGQCEQVRR